MRTLISFEDALACVRDQATTLSSELVPLGEALGRTLSEAVVARANVPPFASSAMDGFAVRSADGQAGTTTLEVIGHIAAGDTGGPAVTPGTCVEIMTGAPFPEGADAVAPIEWVAAREGMSVTFHRFPEARKHVRPAAEDVSAGQIVFEPGHVITPAVVGMLATLGYDTVPVSHMPRVRVITTGNELIAPGTPLESGQIFDSNGPSLRAQVRAAGGFCPYHEHAKDDPSALADLLSAQGQTDLVIFSGGVSVGDHDHVKEVLKEAGAEMFFWKVRQRPGKPLAFGRLDRTLILGLPGNPVSSAMCFEIYGRFIIERMLGRHATTPRLCARLGRDMNTVSGLHFFARGIAGVSPSGELWVQDTGPQRSNLYGSVVRANCIIHVPESADHVPKGTMVSIQMLPWAPLQILPQNQE